MRAAGLVVAAGAAVGLAVEFHYLGWTSIPGNSCGGKYHPCPDGTAPTIVLAFLLTFVGFVGLLAAIASFTRIRPGRSLPAVLVSAGALLALWPGWQAYAWMRGPVLAPVWEAGRDRPATVRGQGVWTAGDDAATVVRVRSDALIAYDSRTGDRRWTLRAPLRESVCGMSERVVDGIGLVAFGRYGKTCDTVWGVDTRTGRKAWERKVSGVETGILASGRGSLLTAGSGVAVALADEAVHGYGLADGTPRWTAKLTEKDSLCEPEVASAAGGSTRVVVTCWKSGEKSGQYRSRLLTLDNATGKVRGTSELPVESDLHTVMVVAADPFTLLLKERDERGVAAVLAYPDGKGDPVRIPLTADEEDLIVNQEHSSFTARPPLLATVSGQSLVVAAKKPGADYAERVSGYSLRDGERLWHADLGITVEALAPAGRGQVAVLGENERLWTLAAADGKRLGEEDGTTVRVADAKLGTETQLLRAGGTWIVVNGDGAGQPPLFGVR